MPVTNGQVIAGLYSAFFNRAPDALGFDYWENQAKNEDSQNVFHTLAAGFATHYKFAEIYDSMTNRQFVEAIYINVLGFNGDSLGIDYWESTINAGSSRSSMVAEFVSGALTINLSDTQWDSLTTDERLIAQNRQNTIINKAEVGLYFSSQLGLASNIFKQNDLENDRAYKNSILVLADINDQPSSVVAAKKMVDGIKLAEPIVNLSNATQQAVDGIAELFVYEINSSNFVIESREAVDIILTGFNVNEDALIFRDVNNGTTNTASFINEAYITSDQNTLIVFDSILVDDSDIVVAEEGVKLTISGVNDFTAIDYYVG